MMVALNASPQMVTLVQASITLPIVLLALVAGALADGFDRRKLMLFAQCFMFAVSAIGGPLSTARSAGGKVERV